MNTKIERLRAEAKAHADACTAIADHAEKDGDRDFTPVEQALVNEHMAKANHLVALLKSEQADEQTKAAIRDLGMSIGSSDALVNTGGGDPDRAERPTPAWAKTSVNPWAKSTVEKIDKIQRNMGGKAIVSGSIDVSSPIFPGVTPMAQYPTRVLDLLVDRQQISATNTFSFLRQTVRTNNAAPVADAATKPTSVYTTAEVEDRVRVLAHISENLPERLFADHGDLQDFLASEMAFGLSALLEAQVVSGAGTGENMTGIVNTSGLLTQAFATDLVTTLRKARTTMANVGEQPTAWLLNPADTEAIDLLREGAGGLFLMASPPGNITGNLPIVESTAITAGTALLGDWNYLRLIERQGATLDVDKSGVLFEKNQLRMRLEGRWGVAVRRSTAFCLVDTSA